MKALIGLIELVIELSVKGFAASLIILFSQMLLAELSEKLPDNWNFMQVYFVAGLIFVVAASGRCLAPLGDLFN